MNHYINLLIFTPLFASLALANGCFSGGDEIFAVAEANTSIPSVCKYLRSYHGDTWVYNTTLENRTACRTYSAFNATSQKMEDNLDKAWYYEIHLISNPKNGRVLGQDECVNGMTKSVVAICDWGADFSYTNWRYVADPNKVPCGQKWDDQSPVVDSHV
ncbi:hypothetical protein BU16DRAFT_557484 [Lophium mytilinum]|uniref:Uncharacterized protein n=1 Tax=Lophium mytilinum TaxID=390894 RepID=A0A6A6R2Z3_9PEZI|nr:hypothetical protein BU16DRAFT_557484 [Lophium mytilinum]